MDQPVVTTTTFATYNNYAETVRANCALKTIEAAVAHGYATVAIDGGSPVEYVEKMKQLGAQVFAQELSGMGNARREALRHARDIVPTGQPIVWTEPEKYPLIPELRLPISTFIEGNYDLVMLRRTSLDSYPPEQAMAYQLIALATKYLTGIDSDFGWGPTVLLVPTRSSTTCLTRAPTVTSGTASTVRNSASSRTGCPGRSCR